MTDRHHHPLVTADELLEALGDPELRLADVRWFLAEPERGQAEFARGHIPGAVFVDLDRDLAAPPGEGRHPLPDPTCFADRMGELNTQMVEHALYSFAQASGTTLHLSGSGRNDHHLAEAAFKALARALRMAVTTDPRRSGVASTKGSLELDGGGA